MRVDVSEEGGIVLSEVYNGVGIQTDEGLFGIAERDGGIEVMLDGRLILGLRKPREAVLLSVYAPQGLTEYVLHYRSVLDGVDEESKP